MEQSDPRKLLIEVVAILDKLRIPYLITGGMAVFVWGRPRFTADIDIVIEVSPQKAGDLEQAFKAIGEGGYVDREMIQEAITRRGEFNFIDGITGVKVDFWISTGDSFDVSRLKRRVAKKILGRDVYFSTPEDLILSKLRWYAESRSARHLEDIQSILALSKEDLDADYLKKWLEKLGYVRLWNEAGLPGF
ncbi:hypothetical protein EPN90_01010 [Patescibacteria group bacterium]|nr:MAG: hypothetical protein EPN90_01010 [Patescibacteria group bacterium]